jgi:hypothetical protein
MGPARRSGSALGVADVDAAHERLRDALPELPAVRRKPVSSRCSNCTTPMAV